MELSEDRPVGMADIAAAASVAISTVSRALSGAPGVSAVKRKEIIEIARHLGYLNTDNSAGHLASDSSRVPEIKELRITAVVPESDRWIFGSILTGIHDVLSPEEVSLQVKQGLSASERARFLRNPHLATQTDLVILVPAPRDMGAMDFRSLPVPAVIAGTVVPGIPSVGIDDVAVGRKATNYLRNLGLTSIAYVGFLDHDGTSGVATHRRGIGYEEAMIRAGLAVWHVKVPFTPNPGRAAAEALLAGENLPQGVICSSDEIAADMMGIFRQAGVTIPDDISIIGVDDHPIAGFLGLTTIRQPAREQGREAAKLALRILEVSSLGGYGRVGAHQGELPISSEVPIGSENPTGGEADVKTITLPTRLIIRETTRRVSH